MADEVDPGSVQIVFGERNDQEIQSSEDQDDGNNDQNDIFDEMSDMSTD